MELLWFLIPHQYIRELKFSMIAALEVDPAFIVAVLCTLLISMLRNSFILMGNNKFVNLLQKVFSMWLTIAGYWVLAKDLSPALVILPSVGFDIFLSPCGDSTSMGLRNAVLRATAFARKMVKTQSLIFWKCVDWQ